MSASREERLPLRFSKTKEDATSSKYSYSAMAETKMNSSEKKSHRQSSRSSLRIPGNNPKRLSRSKTSDMESSVGSDVLDAHGISIDKITNIQAIMHLLKSSIGTGVLTMPSAVRNAGLWLGSIGILIIGGIVVHCMHLLVGCARQIRTHYLMVSVDGNDNENLQLDYQTVVEKSFQFGPALVTRFKRTANWAIQFFLLTTQIGLVSVYLLFVSENVQKFVEHFKVSYKPPLIVYNAIFTLLLLPCIFIKRMDRLAIFASIANFLMVSGLAVIVVYCVMDLPPPSEYPPAVANITTIPLWFGIVVFSFESINLLLPIETKMITRDDMPGYTGVLNTAMMLVVILYTTVGFYGYLRFGDRVDGSITYYIPTDHWILLSIKLLFATSIFVSYLLQFYLLVQIIWAWISWRLPVRYHTLADALLRVLLLLMSFALATGIPKLELLISLIGAWSGSSIVMLFPPLIHTVLFWNERQKFLCFPLVVFKNILIFLLGIAGLLIGTVTSIQELAKS